MKRLFIIFIGLVFIINLEIKPINAEISNSQNSRSELAINSFHIGDYFNMGKLSNVFGMLKVPARMDSNSSSSRREITLFFNDTNIAAYKNDFLYMIFIQTDKDIKNNILSTPRGIHVGSSLNEVLSMYGEKKIEDGNLFYFYPNRGSISFSIKENKVISIMILGMDHAGDD